MTTAREPAWLRHARSLIGTREAAGPANNQTILGWAKKLGTKVLGIAYNADSVPWCGVFVAHCMNESGIEPPKITVRARAWATWGANLQTVRLAPGAVLVFERQGGGHVGLYAGEDATHFHVLGGNQGDRVCITRIARNRLAASRWPRGVDVLGGPLKLSPAGVPVSRKEA